ncbi:uncharacterized protein MONOS_11306 [Monocercomonoides exilis]|uniref:uncharacterized protein n=1 Tax=Monocercomonoides exilis TaxID=2049356 RepID=UPI0035594041|nr:hypothetical protein MONOS_11306 [Monocercomonoides exilis]|eukprot:MONOS_11306.1-p1 / transcript=MONOS_11306.1 / gene=MONOS_11306 / organism=Monocercomonoides_exilis_PA203 / gene_product=unspecified product / transcript_product=unspecified product / location=Mono_scaffold00560:37547-40675(+) / protein_length=947 / sequence_SO=supercontig / SO=protein_coding / is_pseudo=false
MKFKGKMEEVPAGTLGSLMRAAGVVLNSTNSEGMAFNFGSILEIVLNPESFSEGFCASIEKPIKIDCRERVHSRSENSLKKSIRVSQYSSSPLFHFMIREGKLIPGIVKQIWASISDDTISALAKVLFYFVRIAEKDEFNEMGKQGFFDGIKATLIKCNSCVGLHFALYAVLYYAALVKNLTYDYRSYGMWSIPTHELRFILFQIAIGMLKRNVSFDKYSQSLYKIGEIDEYSEDDRFAELLNTEGNSNQAEESSSKTQIIKKPEALHSTEKEKASIDSKRKQTEQQLISSIQDPESKPIEGDGPDGSIQQIPVATEGVSSETSAKEDKVVLPLSIRLEAIRVFFYLDERDNFLPLPWKLLSVLAEGLELPEGAEDEYLAQKKKALEETAKIEKDAQEKLSDCNKDDTCAEENMKFDNNCACPFEACYVTKNMKQIQETLLTTNSCLIDIYEKRKSFNKHTLPDDVTIILLERLNRLMNFPSKSFCILAGCCIECLFAVMSESIMLTCLPSIEENIMADLPLVEKEMIETNIREKLQLNLSTECSGNLKEGDEKLKKGFGSLLKILDLTAFDPTFRDYSTESDYELAQSDISNVMKEMVDNVRLVFNNIFGCITRESVESQIEHLRQMEQIYHYSFSAYRLNHNLICILSAIASEKKNSNEIVLRPLFGFLMSKLMVRFPIQAPFVLRYPLWNTIPSCYLESVHFMISIVVVAVLLNIVKELPYAFEMGYISSLMDWMAEQVHCAPDLLGNGILRIREACIIHTLPSRKHRLELLKTANKKIRNFKSKPPKHPVYSKNSLIETWRGISVLEKEECVPNEFFKSLLPSSIAMFDDVDLSGDTEEVKKKDDSGTLLCRRLEDALEESGIYELIESFPQSDKIDPFWSRNGTIPTNSRKISQKPNTLIMLEFLLHGPMLGVNDYIERLRSDCSYWERYGHFYELDRLFF